MRILLLTSVLALVGSACMEPGGPGEFGSAYGDFSAAYVVASHGALEVVLSDVDRFDDDEEACRSRDTRDKFERQEGLRIRMLAVDDDGDLRRVTSDFFGPQATVEGPVSGPLRSQNAFIAAAVDERDGSAWRSRDIEVAPLGTVTLRGDLNYNTGEVEGFYDLEFDDVIYQGAFITAYCPNDTDVDQLARDLHDYCPLAPQAPYEPGTTGADTLRDLSRALRALGLSDAERNCWHDEVITPYCKGAFPTHWTEASEGGLECLRDAFDVCLGRPPVANAVCKP